MADFHENELDILKSNTIWDNSELGVVKGIVIASSIGSLGQSESRYLKRIGSCYQKKITVSDANNNFIVILNGRLMHLKNYFEWGLLVIFWFMVKNPHRDGLVHVGHLGNLRVDTTYFYKWYIFYFERREWVEVIIVSSI